MPSLYIIPCSIHQDGSDHIPPVVKNTVIELSLFIVERTRTARRFLRNILPDFPIDACTFLELNKHDAKASLLDIESLLERNQNVGMMSEAGTPCIADPGAWVVSLARQKGYTIRALTGPNSIILGLAASGMNGQSFTFHGYLPVQEQKLSKKLKEINVSAMKKGTSQIFIETPYRNTKLLRSIQKNVHPELHLCVAKNLTANDESIQTRKIRDWKPEALEKHPCIFIIGQLQQ